MVEIIYYLSLVSCSTLRRRNFIQSKLSYTRSWLIACPWYLLFKCVSKHVKSVCSLDFHCLVSNTSPLPEALFDSDNYCWWWMGEFSSLTVVFMLAAKYCRVWNRSKRDLSQLDTEESLRYFENRIHIAGCISWKFLVWKWKLFT